MITWVIYVQPLSAGSAAPEIRL